MEGCVCIKWNQVGVTVFSNCFMFAGAGAAGGGASGDVKATSLSVHHPSP